MPYIPPAWLIIAGAILTPLLTGRARNWFVVLVNGLAFVYILAMEPGSSWHVSFFGFDLTLLRVDKLSKLFGAIFTLYGFAASLYSLSTLRDCKQQFAALIYIGSALGVVFAGDLVSLYFYWEVMAVASVILILAQRSEQALGAGYRYVLVHIFGGLCLLLGIVLFIHQTGSVEFTTFSVRNPATYLILLGVLVNAAAPPLHAWLPDAYPEATVTGSVVLSAYTTKTAVYTLIRGFPGWEVLIVLGCLMTIYGIFYALLENDMRRILAYSIINQVGFMVTGAGIGTQMALNGAAAHAFAHIIYKGLLFMSAGSVLYMTGKSKCTDLGGLYKTMPWTLILGCVGALAISAFPLTSGFTTKSMIMLGAEHEHMFWPWLVLEIASAGVFLHAGIKFPYFVFFAKDKGLRPGETNWSMLSAMGILAFLCIFIGVYPEPLYGILPYQTEAYHAYTATHLTTQMQLLMFSALVFFLFLPLLKRTETISLDTDWFYRKGAGVMGRVLDTGLNGLNARAESAVKGTAGFLARVSKDIPARTVLFFLITSWIFAGYRGKRLELKKSMAYNDLMGANIPLGVGAGVSALFVAAFFILVNFF